MPTLFPFLNIPFIWGPLGGGEGVPKSFLKILPLKDRLIQSFRYLLKYSIYLNPLLLYSLYKSKIILVRTRNTLEFIPSFFRDKCRLILETSMEESVFNYKKIDNSNDEIKLIMTGRLVPFKNTLSVIKALEKIPKNYQFRLTIIGSGPEKEKLQNSIRNKSFRDKVTIIDELSRQEVMENLCRSDIYLFPSLREGGSWALMEAMAIGLPVICLNWTGNEIITDESSAIRLEVTSPELLPHEIAHSICNLVDNPTLKSQIGQNARKRIKTEFNWDVKGKFLAALLTEISN
jgi:glycosyltransferase involved in cell wall biosynthesis